MQEFPTGWPTQDGVVQVPQARLVFESGVWPPAHAGLPAGTGEAGAWQVSRELTGGGLPGSARAASGVSKATGSVVLGQVAGAVMSPWAPGVLAVQPGGLCRVELWHPGATLTGLSLGRFVAQGIDGASTNATLGVDLLEASTRLERQLDYQWQFVASAPQMDAAEVVVAAAKRGGYFADAGDDGSRRNFFADSATIPVLRWPLLASARPERGVLTFQNESSTWGTRNGRGGLTASPVSARPAITEPGWATGEWTLAGTLDGNAVSFRVRSGMGSTASRILVMRVSRTDVQVYASEYGARTDTLLGSIVWAEALPAGKESRFYLSVSGTAGKITVRAWAYPGERPTGIGGVLPAATVPWAGTFLYGAGTELTINLGAGAWLADVNMTGKRVVTDSTNPPVMDVSVNALIEASGSPLSGVFGVQGQTAWQIIQDIAKATMSAAWVNEAGQLVFRSRTSMRTGTIVETVHALNSLADLPWETSMDDVADRVELSYTPSALSTSQDAETIWEADKPVLVKRGATVRLNADIQGATDRVSEFRPIWDTSAPAGQGSRWAAAYQRNGGGANPGDKAARLSARMIGPSRAQITITNLTNKDLWMVDGNGNPTIILRTSYFSAQGEAQIVSSGMSEDESLHPFAFDAGQWVQDPATAQEMCDWLRVQTATATPIVNDVDVLPNPARQLGDIIQLTDPITGLSAKALILKITTAGDHGALTQSLSLAVLDATFADLTAWAQTTGVTTFAQLTAWGAAHGVTTFAQLNEALRNQLV